MIKDKYVLVLWLQSLKMCLVNQSKLQYVKKMPFSFALYVNKAKPGLKVQIMDWSAKYWKESKKCR